MALQTHASEMSAQVYRVGGTPDRVRMHADIVVFQCLRLQQLPLFAQCILSVGEQPNSFIYFLYLSKLLPFHTILRESDSQISASADGGPRSRVCARKTLRSAPHRH